MQANAIVVIARSVRSLWLGGLATLTPRGSVPPRKPSASQQALASETTTADRDAAVLGYSLQFKNGMQIIEGGRDLEFSSERAARLGALRIARQMAKNISWEASARGAGWTVLVINPSGYQILAVPVRFKRANFDSPNRFSNA